MDVKRKARLAEIKVDQEELRSRINEDAVIKKDGNMWCAHRESFTNLQESQCGFGETDRKAFMQLADNEQSEFVKLQQEELNLTYRW